jgi:hypothetical protein
MKERLSELNVSVENEPGIEIRPYIDDMAQVMTASDLVICRAGASTIAELTMLGKPSILVPSPNVTNDHQLKKCRARLQSGGCPDDPGSGLHGKKASSSQYAHSQPIRTGCPQWQRHPAKSVFPTQRKKSSDIFSHSARPINDRQTPDIVCSVNTICSGGRL